jgi:hypothetical protein
VGVVGVVVVVVVVLGCSGSSPIVLKKCISASPFT